MQGIPRSGDAHTAVHELEAPHMQGRIAPSSEAETEARRQPAPSHGNGARKQVTPH